jgi:hypothetical protein
MQENITSLKPYAMFFQEYNKRLYQNIEAVDVSMFFYMQVISRYVTTQEGI